MDWYEVKESISLWSGLSMDALHVHTGVLLQILAARVLRRSLADPLAWLTVLAAALANEWFDLAYDTWPEGSGQYQESVRDVVNTLFLPTLLLVLSRYVPALLAKRAPVEDSVQ